MFHLNEGALLTLLLGTEFSQEKYTVCYIILMMTAALLAYLIGSIDSARCVSRLFFRRDIRALGDGESSLRNMREIFGIKGALLSAACEIFKTAFAVSVGGFAVGFYYLYAFSISEGCYLAGLFCMIGQIFPLFRRFQGENAVLCIATICAMLAPIPFALLLLLYAGLLATGKYISLSSVACSALFPVVINGMFKIFGLPEPGIIAVSTIFSAVLIVGTHFENLRRISDQTEPKFYFSMLKELGRKKADDSTSAKPNHDDE